MFDLQIFSGNRHSKFQIRKFWVVPCPNRAGDFGHVSGPSQSLDFTNRATGQLSTARGISNSDLRELSDRTMRSRLSGTRGMHPAQCKARSHAAAPLNLTADVR